MRTTASVLPEEQADPLVVVVAYHGADALRATLVALHDLAVLVVDNSSSEAVRSVAASAGAEYLDAGANLGFARGVNLGLGHARGRDVVLVNPDAVVDSSTVRALTSRVRRGGRVAAAAPSLVGDHGETQRVLWPFPTPWGAWIHAVGLGRWQPSEPGFLVGAVLALSAEALADVGPFDEDYFLYAEETDWQKRAVEAGWRVHHVPGLSASHSGGGTSSDETRRETHFQAGGERYVRKWYGRSGWAVYRTAGVVGALLRSPRRGARGAGARRRAQILWRGPRRAEHALLVES